MLKKKMKFIIIIALICVLSLGTFITGIVLFVNREKPEPTPEIKQVENVKIDKKETSETIDLYVTFDKISEYKELIIDLSYKKNDDETLEETTFVYDETLNKFVFTFEKKENEYLIKDIKIKILDKEYTVQNLNIPKFTVQLKYQSIGLSTELHFEKCFVIVNTTYEGKIYVDTYLNNVLLEENVEIGKFSAYQIDYSNKLENENEIEFKNIRFEDENVYTDEVVKCSFNIENLFEVESFRTSIDKIYYLDEGLEVDFVVNKKYDFKVVKVIINNKEYEVETTETNELNEKIKIFIAKEDLKMNEQKDKYLIVLEKILFEKDYIEPQLTLEVEIKNEKITANISSEKTLLMKNDEQLVMINIENPNGFQIEKVLINDEYIEISDSNLKIEKSLRFTNVEKIELKEVVYLYNEQEYTENFNQEIEFEFVEFPTSYEIKDEYIYTKENEKYIILYFDKEVSDYEIFISDVYYENEEEKSKQYDVQIDKNVVKLNVTEYVEEIGTYVFEIDKIEFKYKELYYFFDLKESETLLRLTYFKEIKDVTFGALNSETGVLPVYFEGNNEINYKILTVNILNENNEIVETKDFNLTYDETLETYYFSTNRFEHFKIKVVSVGYEKEGLLYYTTLPIHRIYDIY